MRIRLKQTDHALPAPLHITRPGEQVSTIWRAKDVAAGQRWHQDCSKIGRQTVVTVSSENTALFL
jgi:hypothetical protein